MKIIFSWCELPQYGARLLRAAIQGLGVPCAVVATRPRVPVAGVEEALGQEVIWVEPGEPLASSQLGLDAPDIFFQSGWSEQAFVSLGQEVKAGGGVVVGTLDNNWRGSIRQMVLGAGAFRLRLRRQFDATLVPGASARRLARHYGFPDDRIWTGLYGADPALFRPLGPLSERPKEFLFVGQFIPRKDVLGLCHAFTRFDALRPGWTLRLCGSGPQRDDLPSHPRIMIEPFVQPEQLPQRINGARFLILPSLEESWGLVVHEAALCGCGLILSDAVGSAPDLADTRNALSFPAGDSGALLDRLLEADAWTDDRYEEAEAASLDLARRFGPEAFGKSVSEIVAQLRPAAIGLGEKVY